MRTPVSCSLNSIRSDSPWAFNSAISPRKASATFAFFAISAACTSSAAIFLIGNSIDPKSVQGRLGHEVSSMTMDVYAHTIGGNDREAADLMGRLLMTGGEGAGDAQGEEGAAGEPDGTPAAPAVAGAEPVRLTVVGPDPDSRPCPGARLVEREVVRDGRTVWVEEWRVTVSSVGELLELQRGLGVPVLLEGGRLTVMAKSA